MNRPTLTALAVAITAITILTGCGADDPGLEADPGASEDSAAADLSSNQPPEIVEVVLRPRQPRRGDALQAEVRATDLEGDPISIGYEWRVDGLLVEASGSTLAPSFLGQGQEIEVSVTAHDGQQSSLPREAAVRMGNQPPMMVGIRLHPGDPIRADTDLVARPSASDPEGDAIEYRFTWWVDGSPRGDESDTLRAGLFKRGDEIQVSVIATDGSFESEAMRSDSVLVANSAPHIVSTPRGFGSDGIFRYRIEVEDADGDSRFTYELIDGPHGMAIDSLDGQMVWRPRESQAGTHLVEFEVGDRHGGKTTQSFKLELAFEETAVPANTSR